MCYFKPTNTFVTLALFNFDFVSMEEISAYDTIFSWQKNKKNPILSVLKEWVH